MMSETAMQGDGADGQPLALDFELPEAPQKVWRALTEPDKLARWLTPAPAGGRLDCALLDQEPGRRVSYRWRDGEVFDGVVTFSIAVNAVGGTRLTIVQTPGVTARLFGAVGCRMAFTAAPTSPCRRDAANHNRPACLRAA